MKPKANLFRTLLVLPVVLMAVALFGLDPRTAETQTTPAHYEVQAAYPPAVSSMTYTLPPYSMNNSGHVVGTWSWYNEMGSANAFLYKDGQMKDLGTYYWGGILGGTALPRT